MFENIRHIKFYFAFPQKNTVDNLSTDIKDSAEEIERP